MIRYFLIGVLLLAALLVAYLGIVIALNRLDRSNSGFLERETRPTGNDAPETISIVTWNIGYGGMGAEADFYMDMGQQRRPASAALVDRNLQQIGKVAAELDPDLLLLQEVARPSFSSHGRNVLEAVAQATRYGAVHYASDILTRLVPPPVHTEIGNATLTNFRTAGRRLIDLPLEPTFEAFAFRKRYRIHNFHLAGDIGWSISNIHLSAFDSKEDDVRGKQVKKIVDFALEEYGNGRHVVIGGDWNLRLVETDFPHQTAEKFLFWIRPFPAEILPEGWRLVTGSDVPTVRTAHQPYVAGDNHTLVIDGFLVSPNVEVVEVQTIDLGFKNTDHHPVQAAFRALR